MVTDNKHNTIHHGDWHKILNLNYNDMQIEQGAQQFPILKFPNFSLSNFNFPVTYLHEQFSAAQKFTRVHDFETLVLKAKKNVKID